MDRSELLQAPPATLVAGVEVTVGSVIPQNFNRYIYRIKFTNNFAGGNLLTIGKMENGAPGTTIIDLIPSLVPGDIITDPEEIKGDALPIYVIYGGPTIFVAPATGTSLVRAMALQAGYFVYWYVDAPG